MKLDFTTKYYLFLSVTVMAYFGVSIVVFDKVFATTKIVIDELFHIPQGKQYCVGNFNAWDSKITTLPGLYLVSTLTLGQVLPCNTYNLRLLNLLASTLNLILFFISVDTIYGQNQSIKAKIPIQALNLAMLPPLYFFSHVYYTDTLSLTFLLLFMICSIKKMSWMIFLFGFYSVFTRQTNIIWVLMLMLLHVFNVFVRTSRVLGNPYLNIHANISSPTRASTIDKTKLKNYYDLNDFYIACQFHLSTRLQCFLKNLTSTDYIVVLQQLAQLVMFAIFYYYNGSIVVGDRSAHVPTIHIPQFFYFLLFYGFFGLPFVLSKLFSTLSFMYHNKLAVLQIATVMVVIVHYNTVVHPYLIADNRHYVFYLWNRWFGKYDEAIYATVPVYVFLLINLWENLRGHNCITFLLPYFSCVLLSVVLQRLIEVRYFIVPFIIIRLRFPNASYKVALFEFLWYLAINIATFYVFFTKEVYWDDFVESQRIIW